MGSLLLLTSAGTLTKRRLAHCDSPRSLRHLGRDLRQRRDHDMRRTTLRRRFDRWSALGLLLAALVVASPVATRADPHGKRPRGVDLSPMFQLKTQHGTPLSRNEIKGRPVAVFFGYTHCPDVCPTTLLEMSQHLEALREDGAKLKVIFVTVDPERDTASHLKDYLSSFDSRIIALTGTPLEIAAVAHSFGATYDRVPRKSADYTIDHTTKVFLLDPYGLVASHLERGQTAPDQQKLLRKLIAQ